MAERLKLRAEDADDLAVISACLQDAIVPYGDMRFVRAENRFMLAAVRFRWEQTDDGRGEAYERVTSAVTIDRVKAVRQRGIGPAAAAGFLNLLALEAGDGQIDLVFAGGGAIRLDVEGIRCRMEDFDEPWPTPSQPRHGPDGDN